MAAVQVALLQALYTALGSAVATAGPSGAAVPVYDHPPQGQAFPFVEIGRIIGDEADLFDDAVTDFQVTLSVWSTYRGQKEVLTILDAIRTGLHDARLTLGAGLAVACTVDRTDTSIDADGVTYMGSALLKIIVQH